MGMLLKSYQLLMLFVSLVFVFIAPAMSSEMQIGSKRVTLHVTDNQVVMDNGILQVTLSKPHGRLVSVKYNNIRNLLEFSYGARNLGGYWHICWNHPGSGQNSLIDTLDGFEFEVIVESEDQVEISFKRKWNSSLRNLAYLNTDVRYVMLRGVSGFYTYSILDHERGWPGFDINEARIAFKLNGDKFKYMVISDNKQRKMPSSRDREPPRGKPLAYKEAVMLVDPIEPEFKGEVDDKYQYSLDNKDSQVHGWISDDPSTGFWVITPSIEFKTGGPLKQDLTSHTGPISLSIIMGDHYVGKYIHFNLQDGEYWKKTFGPIFIYLNSNSNQSGNARDLLWQDAKAQMQKEVKSWPYNFPASPEFLKSNERGSAKGRLVINDRYMSKINKPVDLSYVGLALPGQPGSWQGECKGYQFWTRADANGNFVINNVIPGKYNLYTWVPGFVGDFMHTVTISISAGSQVNLGKLIFKPPRSGPTIWEIGVPDRSAAEFFIPDPNPLYMNKLYKTSEKYRQYGIWDRYTDLYPNGDLVYRVGTSDYRKDWFFAHVLRRIGNEYRATTWQIKFNLHSIPKRSTYMLRIAVATAHMARLEVYVNKLNGRAHFKTHLFGDGNAIARHGIHGFEWNYEVPVDGRLLTKGENTIYLRQSKEGFMFTGILYDYLRFEGPLGVKQSRKLLRSYNWNHTM